MDAEISLVSRMILTGGVEQVVAAGVEPRHFYDEQCRAVYETCVRHARVWGVPPSADAVRSRHPAFEIQPVTDDLGWIIKEFRLSCAYKAGVTKWRDIGQMLDRTDPSDPSYDPEERERIPDLFMAHAREMMTLIPMPHASRLSDMSKRIVTVRQQQEAGSPLGVKIGIPALDPWVHVVRPTELVIHSAYSGVGKTSGLVRSAVVAYEEEADEKAPVVFFSLEMGEDEIWEMFDSRVADLSREAIFKRQLSPDDYERYQRAAERVAGAKNDVVVIDDTDGPPTIDKLAGIVDRLGPRTVCVDYLSLMEAHVKTKSDWERVAQISKALKQMARTFKIRVYAAAQNSADAVINGPTEDNIAFCVPTDTTEILTRRGWLRHDQVVVGDETIGYDSSVGRSRWTRIDVINRFDEAPIVRYGHSRWEAVCTPNHRWVVDQASYPTTQGVRATEPLWTPGLRDTLSINSRTRIRLAAEADVVGSVDSRDAAIVAWLWTDGTLKISDRRPTHDLLKKEPKVEGLIYQKKPAQIAEIRKLLEGVPYTESVDSRGKITFRIRAGWLRQMIDRCGLRSLDPVGFVLSLGSDALSAFVESCYLAEGWDAGGYRMMAQNRGPVLDAMALAVYLIGCRPGISNNGGDKNANIFFCQPFVHGQWMRSEQLGTTQVWCPTTELGSWTMRQSGGAPMLTGNSKTIFQDCNLMVGYHQDAEMAKKNQVQVRLVKARGRAKPHEHALEYWDRDRMIFESWRREHEYMSKMAS